MFDSDMPARAELPSTVQLIRSTILVIVAAIVLLVTVVLPAEYAIDPTGIARALQLTEEAEADRRRDRDREQDPAAPGPRSSLPTFFAALLLAPAHAADRPVLAAQATAASDETVITLQPAEGVEWKFRAARGAQIRYSWRVEGGVANNDMHGSPATGGKEASYKPGRGVAGDEGTLTTGFNGTHGWFFRNRGNRPVTITLRTAGAYSDLKRM